MKTLTRGAQSELTPQGALKLLVEGNARFQSNRQVQRNYLEQVKITAAGQYPFAVILSCIDSRTSAELIFDQGLGDIFSIRVAGNVLNDDVLGSMEFACKLAGSKLIVVMGHSACGAVRGACDGAELGHLSGLLRKIQPSMKAVRQSAEPAGDDFVQRVAEQNVEHVVRQIRAGSPVLETMISEGQVGIVGAMYLVQSGAIEFQDQLCARSDP